jgi:thioredoxin-dependent peroxiredoxin
LSNLKSRASVGAKAPDFATVDDEGKRVSLEDFRGRVVVLYFYPKDDTPTCTVEACSIRNAFPRLDGLSAVVLGVSPDSPASHRKFKQKFALPYTLLADEDHSIAEMYGVWGEKSMFGRRYMGILRTTFIIDGTGRVARVFERVKSKAHGAEVAKAVAELNERH